MIGSGGMARTCLDAFCQVLRIRKVKVWSPNADYIRKYAHEMTDRHGLDIEQAGSAREAVRGVDISEGGARLNRVDFLPIGWERGSVGDAADDCQSRSYPADAG
jgi:hypothetical protein